MPKGKLPKGVNSVGEMLTRRGRGGQFLKEARIGMASRTAAASPRGQRMINKIGRGKLGAASRAARSMDTAQGIERKIPGSGRHIRANVGPVYAPKGSGRLSTIVRSSGISRVLGPVGVILGAKEWKKQGGPSATELLGIKKYKRRPKVKYGGQEM